MTRRLLAAFALTMLASSCSAKEPASKSAPPDTTAPAAPAAPAEPADPVQPQMHRTAAGTLGADGWTAADSTGGGFAVELPGLFNDFEQRTSTEDGKPLSVHTVGTRQGTVQYSATCMPGSLDKIDPDHLGIDGVLSHQPIEQAGMHGLDVRARNASSEARMRYLQAGPQLCILVVDAQQHTPLPEAAAERFLGSFRPPPPRGSRR